jgi:cytidine deaminase
LTVPADLLAAARTAWQNAYVPYSRFRVGAALRSTAGVIHAGANVENASYGLTRCAEQSAIQALATAGEREFTELVVFTDAAQPASPCGACRQVLFEFSPAARVFLVNDQGTVIRHTVSSLLPDGFSLTPPA